MGVSKVEGNILYSDCMRILLRFSLLTTNKIGVEVHYIDIYNVV